MRNIKIVIFDERQILTVRLSIEIARIMSYTIQRLIYLKNKKKNLSIS